MSEFTKIQDSGFIVSQGGLFGRVECPKVPEFTVSAYICVPSSVYASHSLVWLSAIFLLSLVSDIAFVDADAKIVAAIIQSVAIMVIRLFSQLDACNNAMHVDRSSFVVPDSVEFTGLAGSYAPVPLRQELVILSVHDSIFSPSQRDQAVGWIKRLGNRVPLVRLSGHVLTSNENLLLNRYFIPAPEAAQ